MRREAASLVVGLAFVTMLADVIVNAERFVAMVDAAGAEYASILQTARRPRWRDRVSRRRGAITIREQRHRARQREAQLELPFCASVSR